MERVEIGSGDLLHSVEHLWRSAAQFDGRSKITGRTVATGPVRLPEQFLQHRVEKPLFTPWEGACLCVNVLLNGSQETVVEILGESINQVAGRESGSAGETGRRAVRRVVEGSGLV